MWVEFPLQHLSQNNSKNSSSKSNKTIPDRFGHKMVFDDIRHRLICIGGCSVKGDCEKLLVIDLS